MPDWIHAIIYMAILAATVVIASLLLQNIMGLIIGLLCGHLVASAVISRLPGFWGH